MAGKTHSPNLRVVDDTFVQAPTSKGRKPVTLRAQRSVAEQRMQQSPVNWDLLGEVLFAAIFMILGAATVWGLNEAGYLAAVLP